LPRTTTQLDGLHACDDGRCHFAQLYIPIKPHCVISGIITLAAGLPPSWAQRPGADADPLFVTNTAVALYGSGVELQRLRCWRRKLIRHHDSVRPAFYGSMSQRSRCGVGPY
jgi:hypothetical protein